MYGPCDAESVALLLLFGVHNPWTIRRAHQRSRLQLFTGPHWPPFGIPPSITRRLFPSQQALEKQKYLLLLLFLGHQCWYNNNRCPCTSIRFVQSDRVDRQRLHAFLLQVLSRPRHTAIYEEGLLHYYVVMSNLASLEKTKFECRDPGQFGHTET